MPGTVPDAIGPYRINGVLGRGAMGIVYSGIHTQSGATAAIKTVYEHEASRFLQIRREIRALARLDHPGVVRILDYGAADGLPWYAMERLEGTTLNDVFNRLWQDSAEASATHHRAGDEPTEATDATTFHPSAEEESETVVVASDSSTGSTTGFTSEHGDQPAALPLFPYPGAIAAGGRLLEGLSLLRGVCETLSFLHGEGVIHRDLKPGNIFIRETGEPVLVDFGLAEEAGGATGREQIHASQKVGGSPSYMSPEQIRGEALDARSDLYSLGCVLYQFITGQAPFAGNQSQTIHGHLNREPLVPSTLVEDVPPALDRLVVSLLAKDQADRLGYAETVANALADFGAPRPAWSVDLPGAKPYLYRSSFVGRRDTLTMMDRHLGDVKVGEGRLVLVSGESGAGKTRLALETGTLARRSGFEVIAGECALLGESGADTAYASGAPLHPFRPLVDALSDRCVESGADELARLFGERIAVLAAYFPTLKTLPGVVDLPPPPPLPSAAARDRLFRALAASLSAYLDDRALLLVVDDLQWADDLSLGFIKHLLDEALSDLPLLLFGTFRSEERTETLESLFIDPKVEARILRRMNVTEVGEMTRGILAMRKPPEGFVTFLADRGNGNPFFIAEYIRGAVSEQLLIRDRLGRWSLTVDGTDETADYRALPLPRSLQQLIEMRLGKLEARERQVVDIAALMGRVLDIRVLQVVEGVSDDAMLDIADELVSRQIIEPADGENYRFVHAKIGEIAESALPRETRRGTHRRLAEAFETVYTDGPAREDSSAAIGRHWALAEVPRKAVPYLRDAADRARQFHSVAEAIALYGAALREVATLRTGQDTSADWRGEALTLNESHGEVLALRNRHGEARAAFDRAIADAADNRETLARLHRRRGKTYEIEHDHDAALRAYGQAEAALGDRDALSGAARNEWIQITLDRAWVYYWLNRPGEIDTSLEAVRPFVEDDGLATHRYHYFMALVNRNHRRHRYRVPDETLTFARRMLQAAVDSDAASEIAFAHFILGFALLFAGNLDESESELFEASQACRRIGDAAGETRAMAYLAIVHTRRSAVDEAAEIADSLMSIAKQRSMHDYLGVAQATRSWVAWRRGDTQTAGRLGHEALKTWKSLSFPYPFQWTAGLVCLALSGNDEPDAETLALARLLRDPPQIHLPDPIHEALGQVLAAETGTAARDAVKTTVRQAQALGFL